MINQPSSIFAGGCIKSHEFLLGTVFLLFHIDICGENRNRIDGAYALSSIAFHTRNLCVFISFPLLQSIPVQHTRFPYLLLS